MNLNGLNKPCLNLYTFYLVSFIDDYPFSVRLIKIGLTDKKIIYKTNHSYITD